MRGGDVEVTRHGASHGGWWGWWRCSRARPRRISPIPTRLWTDHPTRHRVATCSRVRRRCPHPTQAVARSGRVAVRGARNGRHRWGDEAARGLQVGQRATPGREGRYLRPTEDGAAGGVHSGRGCHTGGRCRPCRATSNGPRVLPLFLLFPSTKRRQPSLEHIANVEQAFGLVGPFRGDGRR